MGITVSSKSFADDVLAYTATRLARAHIGLLWLVLTGCALFVSSWPLMTDSAMPALLAALLIAQFRLWDDLADHRHDAQLHPQRVLISTLYRHKFVLLCIVLAVPSVWMLWFWRDPAQRLGYAALCAAMAVLYIASPHWPRIARGHLVLLKYPVLTWLCAISPQTYRALTLGMTLWLVLALIDMHSDPSMRSSPYWRWIKNVEFAALLVLAVLALQHAPEALREFQAR